MKEILYLGTSLRNFPRKEEAIHYPVIKLIPKNITDERVVICLKKIKSFSHFLFTSKNTVDILWDLCEKLSIDPISSLEGRSVSIGDFTTNALREKGVEPAWQSLDSTQEGLINLLQKVLLKESYVFYPRSSLARSLLLDFLIESNVKHEALDLYDTVYQAPDPKPILSQISEIFFSSPSTVEGFFKAFDAVPKGVSVSFQGPITRKKFFEKIDFSVD
jgi:uroporphyrinogen-III synthase